MSDHQFLFAFVFSPFHFLWKIWKIVDGREWGCGRVTVNMPKQSLHHVHEKGIYFSKTATAFTQKFWMKGKPAMFLFYQFLLWFLTVTCSFCPYLYFGSAIMLVTYFVNFR